MYGNFAGRDASRGMAKQSFDLGMFRLPPCFSLITHTNTFARDADPRGSAIRQVGRPTAGRNVSSEPSLQHGAKLHHTFIADISENMKGVLGQHCVLCRYSMYAIGWIDHFSNKYIVCGNLVENDAV